MTAATSLPPVVDLEGPFACTLPGRSRTADRGGSIDYLSCASNGVRRINTRVRTHMHNHTITWINFIHRYLCNIQVSDTTQHKSDVKISKDRKIELQCQVHARTTSSTKIGEWSGLLQSRACGFTDMITTAILYKMQCWGGWHVIITLHTLHNVHFELPLSACLHHQPANRIKNH